MKQQHTFHIPVMGTAFTADTPLKVSQFGIDSVIALADDVLLERLRKVYADKNNLQYEEIKNNTKDYRADRITSYLNLVNKLAAQKYAEYTTATKEKAEALTYEHYWKKDDFMMVDNLRFLHGRRAYDKDDPRELFVMQSERASFGYGSTSRSSLTKAYRV